MHLQKNKALVALAGVLLSAVLVQTAIAANTPCSGRKGGVSHCRGEFFICNDGTTSKSKRVCSSGDALERKSSKKDRQR